MPQISASLDTLVINAVSELALEQKPSITFSKTVNFLLSTHPKVVEKINKKLKPSKK